MLWKKRNSGNVRTVMNSTCNKPLTSRCAVTFVLAILVHIGSFGLPFNAHAQEAQNLSKQLTTEPPLWDRELLSSEDPSGWLSIEVAVLIDTRSDTLNSETWPARPTVTYPLEYRSLFIAEELERISERYPFSDVTINDTGTVNITMPEPSGFIARDKQRQLERARARLAADLARTNVLQATKESAESSFETDSPTLLSLESLATEGDGARPAIDSLSAYYSPERALNPSTEQVSTPLPGQVDSSSNSSNGALDAHSSMRTPPVMPPPLPTAFTRRPMEILATGLNELRRQTNDEVAITAAWLQPPEASNLPIVLDESGDQSDWPSLQGFVELRRGDTIRLGVNFWLNTDGSYLPENFYVGAPPRGHARVRHVDALTERLLAPSEIASRQAQLTHYENERPIMQRALLAFLKAQVSSEQLTPSTEYPNPITVTNHAQPIQHDTQHTLASTPPNQEELPSNPSPEQITLASIFAAFPSPLAALQPDTNDDAERDIGNNEVIEPATATANLWPYRHVIHLADTRVIPEGKVRYFDHPAIKILAAYRELTWGEVYAQGIAEMQARKPLKNEGDVDILALPAANEAPPSMVLPPSLNGAQ